MRVLCGRMLSGDMMPGVRPVVAASPYDAKHERRVPRVRIIDAPANAAVSLLLLSLGGILAPSSAARAQALQNTALPATTNVPQLQEVIVTAEKRRENIQVVPVSLTAISGKELQEQGITDMTAAAQEVPGVAVTTAGPGQTQYTIRGLSTRGTAVSTVAFYIDGAPMTPPTGSQNGTVFVSPDLFDVSRVEVLRGPQGTLYGAGSMGGTIRLITNQPDLIRFTTDVESTESETESGGGFNWDEDGMLNIPIVTGMLAVRIVGTDSYTSGWIKRIVEPDFPLPTNPQPQCGTFAGCTRGDVLAATPAVIHDGVNDEDLRGGRVLVLYTPTDRLSITGEYLTQQISQGGLSSFDDPPDTEAHYQPFDIAEPFSDTFHLDNLKVNYRLPAFTVTSVSSYWRRDQFQQQDASEVFQADLGLPCFAVACGGGGPEVAAEQDGTSQASEEVRLTSPSTGKLQWLVGGFYSNYHYGQYQNDGGAGNIALFGTPTLYSFNGSTALKQTAGFLDASYKITNGLKAAAGLRKYGYTETSNGTAGGLAEGLQTKTEYVTGESSGLSPEFTLSYDIDHLLVYTTASKGFRPGAGEVPIPTSGIDSCLSSLEALGLTQAPTQYKPDTIWSYELGEKANLFDDRVTLNTDAYHEHWTQVQQGVSLPCGFGFIGNIGTATVNGGEFELLARLSPSWLLEQNGGYTHAYFTSTAPGTAQAVGQQLLDVPRFSTTTSLVFRHPVGDYTLVARATNTAQGSSEALAYFMTRLPGYDVLGARVGIVGDNWSAFVFADNLTDVQAYLGDTANYLLNVPSVSRIATNQPRTIGVTFELHSR